MAWRIGRSLEWIGRALGSPVGQSPSDFDSAPVNPIADVLQQGLALADWQSLTTSASGVGVENTILLPRDNDLGRLWMLSAAVVGTAGTVNWRINYTSPFGSAVVTKFWGVTAAAAATDYNWSLIGNGMVFAFLPPGFELVFRTGGHIAPDVTQLRLIWADVPAGTRPW